MADVIDKPQFVFLSAVSVGGPYDHQLAVHPKAREGMCAAVSDLAAYVLELQRDGRGNFAKPVVAGSMAAVITDRNSRFKVELFSRMVVLEGRNIFSEPCDNPLYTYDMYLGNEISLGSRDDQQSYGKPFHQLSLPIGFKYRLQCRA